MFHPVSIRAALAAAVLATFVGPASAQMSSAPGRDVESLLELARASNPEFAAMRHEAAAAQARPEAASSFPDPMFRVELMDITNAGSSASPSLNPSKIGATKYTLLQPLPWFGKRDAKTAAAVADAEVATSRADLAWADLAARVKTAYAQYYAVAESERLTREVLDLITRLESIAQARYAGGLAAQQDAIRAQVEQTTLRTDLVMVESERRRLAARLNTLVARPASALLGEPQRIRALPAPAKLQPADLEERVRTRNPAVLAEAARVRSAGKQVETAGLNYFPDVSVGISPIQMGNKIGEWEVMFEFSLPLWPSGRRAQDREARSMLDAATARHESATSTALGELAENLAALEAARRTESLVATSLLPQADLTFESALAGYENGKVDFSTLLDAQRQIRRAKQERLKAQAEAQARLADIERILGADL